MDKPIDGILWSMSASEREISLNILTKDMIIARKYGIQGTEYDYHHPNSTSQDHFKNTFMSTFSKKPIIYNVYKTSQ